MAMTIEGEKWECRKCGKYYYINRGVGKFGTRCPFCLSDRGIGKYIKDVRIMI